VGQFLVIFPDSRQGIAQFQSPWPKINGTFRVVTDSPHRISTYVVYSDANAIECGADLDIDGEQVCNKQWDLVEHRQSSTWRELSAILFALHSLLPLLVGSYIKWFPDSQSACKII